jgi:hypothetical protein
MILWIVLLIVALVLVRTKPFKFKNVLLTVFISFAIIWLFAGVGNKDKFDRLDAASNRMFKSFMDEIISSEACYEMELWMGFLDCIYDNYLEMIWLVEDFAKEYNREFLS